MKFLLKNKIALAAVSILATGALGYAAVTYNRNNQPEAQGPSKQEQKTADESTASTENTDNNKEETLKQSQQENQGATEAKAPDFSLALVRAGQGGAGQNVEIRALVSGVSEGSCSVTFSGSGRSFTKTSNITFDGRTTSCGALDAAPGDFSAGGAWTYTLKATSGSKASNQIEDKVTVQK